MFLAQTHAESIWQRDYIELHLSGFGLLRNPNKGVWEPAQKLVHLGLEIDTSGSPTLPRELAALAGKCRFLYLAVAPARFYLRELHDVLKTRDYWSGRVKLTRQLEICNVNTQADGFESFLPMLRNRHIRLHEDIQAVVGVLTHLTSRSPRLMAEDNNKHKEQRDIPSDDDEVCEGGKEQEHDARTAAATGGARGATTVFIDPRDWEDLFPRAYGKTAPPPPPPLGATRPSLWRPRNDEADRYLVEASKTASRDEYRHLLCYGVYRAAANAAAKTALATLRALDTPTQDRVDAPDLLDAAHRTLQAVGDADEARLTYLLRRFNAKKALTHEEQYAILDGKVLEDGSLEEKLGAWTTLLTPPPIDIAPEDMGLHARYQRLRKYGDCLRLCRVDAMWHGGYSFCVIQLGSKVHPGKVSEAIMKEWLE
eukprot:jgi/Tetstr1/441731/TSEL_029954.t1